jgi:hypothetical protein
LPIFDGVKAYEWFEWSTGPTEATSLEYTRLSVSQDILFNEISEVDCVRNVAKISVVPT